MEREARMQGGQQEDGECEGSTCALLRETAGERKDVARAAVCLWGGLRKAVHEQDHV